MVQARLLEVAMDQADLIPMRQRLYITLFSVLRAIIPRPEDRTPLNKSTWPHLLEPVFPILYMAYLVQKPNTQVFRALMFPIVLLTSIRAGFYYRLVDPQYNAYNFSIAFITLILIAKALEYAFLVDVIKRSDDTVSGRNVLAITTGSPAPGIPQSRRVLAGVVPPSLKAAVESICSSRGIGYEYGRGVAIPPETRPLEKGPFLRASFRAFVVDFIIVDVIDAAIFKPMPSLQRCVGSSIFIGSLSWPMRYVVSTGLQAVTAFTILTQFTMAYNLFAIIGVGVLSHPPTAWPPIFNEPWMSQSLHEFWGSRWHQILRRTFMIYGGLPGKRIAKHIGLRPETGMRLGVFIASGLMHEVAAYGMGCGLDWQSPGFFLLQGFLVHAENLWRKVTGRRVGGWPGTLWAYFAVGVLGQNMIDSWVRRGYIGILAIPPTLSPARRMGFPLLNRLTERLWTLRLPPQGH